MNVSNTVEGSRLRPSIIWPVIMIVVGLVALWLPVFSSIGVARLLGWLLVIDAGFQLVHAFRSHGAGPAAWKVLVAAVYLIAGIYFLTHPFLAVAVVTLALAMFFLVEGLVDVFSFLATRTTAPSQWALVAGSSYWILVNGIISIILAVMIWRHWPAGSLWILGIMVGIGLLMTGISRLMMALAIRTYAKQSGPQRTDYLRAA
jgi:uncharacterized membrane protein HdeD (DUF308 family)